MLIVLLMLAAPLLAQEAAKEVSQPDPVAAAVAEIEAASKSHDLAKSKAACEQAEAIAKKLDASKDREQLEALAAAVGVCIKKNQKKHPDVTLVAMETLGDLHVDGSSKLLGSLLKPPSKIPEGSERIYLAAIGVAGEIHDAAAVQPLLKLLRHKNSDIAVASAKAFAGYRPAPRTDRLALVGKLNKELAGFERKHAKSKKFEQRDSYGRLVTYLRASMTKLAVTSTATTSGEWGNWVKAEVKKERANKNVKAK
ncbi:MAG: HEAT repeat domain-containing protein [Planctomycetota bacterium]